MAVSVRMSGNYIPPFFVLLRKNYRDYFIARVLDGSTGFANKSGWMTGDNFVLYKEPFIKHTRLTEDKPAFILLYNYQSHLNIKILDLAKESGVMMSFPPHTALKKQP
jgi:hypothetical protein